MLEVQARSWRTAGLTAGLLRWNFRTGTPCFGKTNRNGLLAALNLLTRLTALERSALPLVHGFADLGSRFLSVLSHGYFPELELEADALVAEPPPAPLAAVGLPRMVRSEVFLLGANTELKSCPIPCMVLQPVAQAAIAANAKIRTNMFASNGCESPPGNMRNGRAGP